MSISFSSDVFITYCLQGSILVRRQKWIWWLTFVIAMHSTLKQEDCHECEPEYSQFKASLDWSVRYCLKEKEWALELFVFQTTSNVPLSHDSNIFLSVFLLSGCRPSREQCENLLPYVLDMAYQSLFSQSTFN